jgi:hypothetical protein
VFLPDFLAIHLSDKRPSERLPTELLLKHPVFHVVAVQKNERNANAVQNTERLDKSLAIKVHMFKQ